MGFFFLLAGYYMPSSYERKGPSRFLADRLLRLGVPLLVYFFVLEPLTVALACTSKGLAFWPSWWAMIRLGDFAPGPLWFAEALLLFAGGYVVWRKIHLSLGTVKDIPSFRVLAITAFILGVVSFLLRLVIPVGKEFAWMQIGYFPCYTYLFIAGCAAGSANLLEQVALCRARPWMIVSFLAILTLPIAIFLNLGRGAFEGGWSSNALYYALWDPLMAWGIILGMLWATRTYWSRATPLTDWMARNAYGAYIVHPPIVVGFSLIAATWKLNPEEKFIIVGTAACIGSAIAANLLRTIPGAQRIL